jgi:vitamin-K-epoxide reductase (warfarin-sensitive)
MFWYIYLLAALGFVFSLYLYFVDKKVQTDPRYKPACDLSDQLSCSTVAKSGYGDIFYVPLSVIGIFYYPFVAMLLWFRIHWLLLAVTSISVLVSLYLAYIQFAKIRAVCIVCSIIYLINIGLFLNALNLFLNF